MNAHKRNDWYLDEIMPSLGFQTMVNADEVLEKLLPGQASRFPEALSVQQFFAGLTELINSNRVLDTSQPFFVGGYNEGTHAFMDIPQDGVKYCDGKNYSLNTIHNFDQAFGNFLKGFLESDIAKNTILIVTSDHCHFEEPEYVSAFADPTYVRAFIDRVPLGIYIPGLRSPQVIDARDATAINLAPTVAHLLGLPDGPSPWMGNSLFEGNKNRLT